MSGPLTSTVVRGRILISAAMLLAGVVKGGERDFSPHVPVVPAGGAPFSRDASGGEIATKIHALLAGDPVRVRSVALVPIHAPTPSRARLPVAARPVWAPTNLRVKSVGPRTLSLRNAGTHPALSVPGRVYGTKTGQLRPLHPVVTPVAGTAYVRGSVRGDSGDRADRRAQVGWLDALATGRLLAGGSIRSNPFNTDQHAGSSLGKRLLRETRTWNEQSGGTIVGLVALVGGEPVLAVVCGDRALFDSARRDIVAIVVATARRRVVEGLPDPVLRQRAARANNRGRAVAFLRVAVAARGTQREIAGAGQLWLGGGAQESWVARALIDPGGSLTYFGAWRVPPRLTVAPVRPVRPPPPRADSEEDPKRKKSGRWNPFRNKRGANPTLPPRKPTVPKSPNPRPANSGPARPETPGG